MKIAITLWGNKVSPVFDACEYVLLVTLQKRREVNRELVPVKNLQAVETGRLLQKRGVEWLVCGAITRVALEDLIGLGLKVTGYISGNVEQIITAICYDEPIEEMFDMPGRPAEILPHRNAKSQRNSNGKGK